MPRHCKKIVAAFGTAAVFAAVVGLAQPLWPVKAANNSSTVTEGINIEGSVSGSTVTNTINQENPATLALLTKALSDKDASEEYRRQAEAKAAELATKLGFTSAAVVEFFKILGEQSVPEEKVPTRLIEVATHFAQTRDELAALEPDDARAAELARSAKQALDSGRLAEADALLDQAKEGELAALRQAHELKTKAEEAEDRHALNAAKFLGARGSIAATQLHYIDAAKHYVAAAAQLPPSASDGKAVYLIQAGDMWETSGNLAAALTSYQASLAIRERLAKADPGNAG